MSEDAPVSRKERKAQRDAERHRGSKKRKREDDEADKTATSNAQAQDFIPLTSDAVSEAAAVEKFKDQAKADVVAKTDVKPPKGQKGHKKRKIQADVGDEKDESQKDPDTTSTTPSKSRFILFIGNLPYTTTDTSLQNYFKSIAPFTLRHRTDPKTKKSKGFAFLEFENYDRMKTCLKLYHHSMFNPEQHGGANADGKERKGKDKGARRINVELTAGGGGNKEGRMEKIKQKNVRLDEQRKRRAEAERKEKEKERLKEAKGKRSGRDGDKRKGGHGASGENAEQSSAQHAVKNDDASQVHPSRLARVMG